jgi:hypothetical protein
MPFDPGFMNRIPIGLKEQERMDGRKPKACAKLPSYDRQLDQQQAKRES